MDLVSRRRSAHQCAGQRDCARCHQHGNVGQAGLGPDLTTVASRMKRRDLLEAIVEPSKVIADQYRALTVETTGGEIVTGLAAINNGKKRSVTSRNCRLIRLS